MSSDVLCMGTATVTDGIIQLLCTNHIRVFTTLQKNSSVSTYVYTQPCTYLPHIGILYTVYTCIHIQYAVVLMGYFFTRIGNSHRESPYSYS